ncbi:MAG: glycosyltransferase, partial [Lysobacterales bacterium]
MDAESRVKNIVVVAGGTGGHVYPALAVALELQERGYRIHWLGTEAGLEARVVPAAGIELHFLRVQGLRGKGLSAKLQGLVLAC